MHEMSTNSLAGLIEKGVVWYPSGEAVSADSAPFQSASSAITGHNQKFRVGDAAVDSFIEQYPCFGNGTVQEFFFANELSVKSRNVWFPAADVVSRMIANTVKSASNSEGQKCPPVFWVGSKIFPSPHLLKRVFVEQELEWEHSNFFLDPESKESRHAIALDILRSSALFALVMDGSGLNLKATRQLQLAAEQSGAFCFLLRPPWEIDTASSAHTKWRVSPLPAAEASSSSVEVISGEAEGQDRQPWKLELYKAKGARAPMEWVVGVGSNHTNSLEEKRLA